MKKAKLFKNGDSQAVRLPKEFRFDGKEVFIEKIKDGIIIIQNKNPWKILENSLEEFSEDVFIERNQPKMPKKRTVKL